MDDDLSKLEAELKSLRPVTPSPTLSQGIDHAMGSPRRGVLIRRLTWLAFPIAAAIAILWATTGPRQITKGTAAAVSAPATFKPITAENVLLSSRDEGAVTLPDGTAARRVRQMYVDTITWKNPRTNASLTWSLPREEVRVIPMTLQ